MCITCTPATNICPICRSSMFYNFVKAMLVRNPKKRPSACKLLSVSTAHMLYAPVQLCSC